MKTLLIASSAIALLAVPAIAQDYAQDPMEPPAATGQAHGDVYTDDHHWVGAPVYSSDGERVGSVEKVKVSGDVAFDAEDENVAVAEAEADVEAILVGTGGFLGIGTREVAIDPAEAELTMVDGDERLVVDYTEAEFEDLPEHEANDARDDSDW
jgi:opacity protein-like surface antigen